MRSRDEIFGHILCSEHCKAGRKCAMFAKLLLQDLKAPSQGTHERAWGIVNWVARIISIATDIQIQILGSDWVWKCRSVHLYWFPRLTKELIIALNKVWALLLLWQRVQTFLCRCFDVAGVLMSYVTVCCFRWQWSPGSLYLRLGPHSSLCLPPQTVSVGSKLLHPVSQNCCNRLHLLNCFTSTFLDLWKSCGETNNKKSLDTHGLSDNVAQLNIHQ